MPFLPLIWLKLISFDALPVEGVNIFAVAQMNLIQTHCPQGGVLELFEYRSGIKGFLPAYNSEMEIHKVKLGGCVEGHMGELLFG